ncbi:hypothetical protein [Pseudomonas sp. URMO17WK12:I11]|uniref:hypothetical protein n=1 Tax=Pseudomonas sp. URMO17WK12:I11 TaxID=1283291 RepID=UPI0018D66BF3|nr:hypothetical protein [Pseudomonas sp. URMO17WK12:I11]MBH3364812.1 hypothetical protein [Pseudomonas sp. URMO17WK12:I11]
MSNHTPGPWFSPDDKTIKQDYRPIGLTESAGCMIASVMGGPTSGPAFIEVAEEVAANTRLIAAAPQLLEALERIAREHDCGCVPCTGSCRSKEALEITVEEIQEIARAALAKARVKP